MTVGFGDFHPLNDDSKIFCCFYIFIGLTLSVSALNFLISYFAEKTAELQKAALNRELSLEFDMYKELVDPANIMQGAENIFKKNIMYRGVSGALGGAGGKLLDGAGELFGGAGDKIMDGAGDLLDGAEELLDGAGELLDDAKGFIESGAKKVAPSSIVQMLRETAEKYLAPYQLDFLVSMTTAIAIIIVNIFIGVIFNCYVFDDLTVVSAAYLSGKCLFYVFPDVGSFAKLWKGQAYLEQPPVIPMSRTKQEHLTSSRTTI